MFTKEDFKNQQNQAKIQVIIMDRLGFDITTSYHDLSMRDKRRFEAEQNILLNGPAFKTDEWEVELNALSSDIVRSFMEGKNFNPSRYANETIGTPDLNCERVFRSEEEKQTFEENERIQKERYNDMLKRKLEEQQQEISV